MSQPADVPPTAAEESFGHLIARRRREIGLSQRDLADKLCAATGRPTVTRHELSRYERESRLPTAQALAALATCLDLPPALLAARLEIARRHRADRVTILTGST